MIKHPLALLRRTLISASGRTEAAGFAMQGEFLWLLACAGALGGGLGALCLGFFPKWDMLNYYLYNPHALLSGRLNLDVAPAGSENFRNPALFIPYYLGFLHLPLKALVFLTGMLQGAQLALLFAIAAQLVPNPARHRLLLLPIALLGLLGPIFIEQLGLFRGDTLISLPLLGAVLLLTRELKAMGMETANSPSAPRTGIFLLAGALAGLAVALKLTGAIYALGLLLATGLAFRGIASPLLFSLGGAMGLLAGGGPWFAYLWLAWDNPVFPYFNKLFQSDWAAVFDYRDPSFMLQSWWEALCYPLIWAAEQRRVWYFFFFDPRPVILYPLMFILPLAFWRRGRLEFPGLWFLLVFLAISYTAWLIAYPYYSYLSVLEMLAPLALYAILACRARSRRALMTALLAVLLTQHWVVIPSRPDPDWNFSPDAATSLTSLPPNAALVIDIPNAPLAYAALWLTDEQPLIRIRDYPFLDFGSNRLASLALERVRDHEGPLYLLHRETTLQADYADYLAQDLAAMNLHLEASRCLPLFEDEDLASLPAVTVVSVTVVCPLTRITPPLVEEVPH